MMHSVRLRLICRRQGFLHELMQLIAKHLRKPDAQPEPSADAGFGRSTLAVYHSLCQRQVDNPVNLSSLNEETGNHRSNPVVYDNPAYAAYVQRLAASQNHFVHQNTPQAENLLDLASVNARLMGVEP